MCYCLLNQVTISQDSMVFFTLSQQNMALKVMGLISREPFSKNGIIMFF